MKMLRKDKPSTNRQGMTLVELMISLSIFGVVMGVIFGFLTGARTSYQETRERAQYQQSMRAVMSLVTREVRSSGCDPSGAGFEPVAVAAARTLQCAADLNGDGDVTDTAPDESVTYFFNAATGELLRFDGATAMVILRDLNDLTFSYFDATGTALNGMPLNALDRALVRYVEMTLDGETRYGEPVTYTTRVALRNG